MDAAAAMYYEVAAAAVRGGLVRLTSCPGRALVRGRVSGLELWPVRRATMP